MFVHDSSMRVHESSIKTICYPCASMRRLRAKFAGQIQRNYLILKEYIGVTVSPPWNHHPCVRPWMKTGSLHKAILLEFPVVKMFRKDFHPRWMVPDRGAACFPKSFHAAPETGCETGYFHRPTAWTKGGSASRNSRGKNGQTLLPS